MIPCFRRGSVRKCSGLTKRTGERVECQNEMEQERGREGKREKRGKEERRIS